MAVWTPNQRERELVAKIQRRMEECKSEHSSFERTYERNNRVYKGVLEIASDAAKWRHKQHPPYAFNLLETIVSNTAEQGLKFDVRPDPQVNMSLEDATQMLQKTDSVSNLLRHELRVDRFDYKQRPLFLTAAIGGRGILANHWNYQEKSMRRQDVQENEIRDSEDNYLGSMPEVVDVHEHGVYRDHSTSTVVDPRDFIVHPSAKSAKAFEPGGAMYLFHRCWYSIEQLRLMEAAGYVRNVDYLVESRNQGDEPAAREQSVHRTDTKGLIECWEYWCMEAGEVHRVLTSASGVILRDAANDGQGHNRGIPEKTPFDHGEYPFSVVSTMPQPFEIGGTSEIELIEELQEILWKFINQRLDNLELINNFITLVRDDMEDMEFPFFPGAQWFTQSPQDVSTLQPPYQLGEMSIHAEALIKGDLQNVTSAAPFAGGAETATVDQKTATGASIVMNAAQARLISKKWEAMGGVIDSMNQRLANCQQFIDEPKLVHILGADGATAFEQIDRQEIQGGWLVELNPESDSNMRQERRAEATQFFQVAAAAAPLMAASGMPLNMGEVFKWYAKKWDIIDADKFLSVQPASSGAVDVSGGAGGGGAGGAPQSAQPNLGVTTPAAPGTEVGASPVQALQRALQMGGGSPGIPTLGR